MPLPPRLLWTRSAPCTLAKHPDLVLPSRSTPSCPTPHTATISHKRKSSDRRVAQAPLDLEDDYIDEERPRRTRAMASTGATGSRREEVEDPSLVDFIKASLGPAACVRAVSAAAAAVIVVAAAPRNSPPHAGPLPPPPLQVSSKEEPRHYSAKIAWNARNNSHMPLLATGAPAINCAIKVCGVCGRTRAFRVAVCVCWGRWGAGEQGES